MREREAHSLRIKTPDQRLRVFISSTANELAEERRAASEAVQELRLSPILYEVGARPHSPQEISEAYVAQSHIFIGIYWQSYGSVEPGEEVSHIDAEMALAGEIPKLIYIKGPAPDRDPRLEEMLERLRSRDAVSYRPFETPDELRELIKDDLVVMLTERFEQGSDPSRNARRARPDHLPSFVNQFVGRDRELRELREMLLQDDVRLVTLTGPGGIGKSRLALEVGAIVRGEHERAARFFGAAEGMRRASQFPLLPFLQGRWDGWTSRLKAQIGEEAFRAGFDEGLAMTLQDAVAYADSSRVDT